MSIYVGDRLVCRFGWSIIHSASQIHKVWASIVFTALIAWKLKQKFWSLLPAIWCEVLGKIDSMMKLQWPSYSCDEFYIVTAVDWKQNWLLTQYFITSVCAFPLWWTFVDLTPLTRDLKCICSHMTTVYFSVRFNLRTVVGLDESNDYMVWVTVVRITVKLSVCTPRGHMGEPRHWSIHSKPRPYTRECSSFTLRALYP
jgi:hypothetical protein